MPQMPMRYLLFSEQAGVYLGGDKWSYINPGNATLAPTFEKNSANYALVANFPKSLKIEMKEVWPDRPGFRASMDAVANAGLPRWDGSAPTPPQVEEAAPAEPPKVKEGEFVTQDPIPAAEPEIDNDPNAGMRRGKPRR